MAQFEPPANLTARLERVRRNEYEDTAELIQLIVQIESDPELAPRKAVWMASHRRAEVRALAGRLLRGADEESTVDLLVREMSGQAGPVRAEIAALAVEVSPKRVYRAVGHLLGSRHPGQRLHALELVKANPNRREFRGHLRSALRDADARVRGAAVEILAAEPDEPTARLFLIGLVRDGEPETRAIAIRALADHPAPDVVEPFLERIPYEDTRMQATIVKALQSLAGDPGAKLADRLLPLLADEHEEVRDAAIRMLRDLPDRVEVVRAYIRFTHGLAFWLRDRSYQTFLRIAPDILDPVIALLDDENPEIRIGAILIAADSGKRRVVPHLFAILRGQDEWWVRVVAAEALARIPSPEIVDALIDQLTDPETRYAIVSVLGRLGNTRAVPALIGCLGDADPTIRMAALDALAEMRLPSVADATVRAATGDEDEAVREKALVVLRAMGGLAAERRLAVEAVLRERERERERELRRTLELEMVNPNL